MNYNKSNYIVLNENSFIFLTKNDCNLVVESKVNENSNFNFFSINETGRRIVELIRGDKSLDKFVEQVCALFMIDSEEDVSWIIEFIKELENREVVIMTDSSKEHPRIRIYGNNDLIAPLHATIELTDKCNLKCKHCYLSASSENNTFIDIIKFKKIVEDLKSNGVLNVELTGGEIFLNPDHIEIIKLCLEKFASIGILTNGTMITNEAIDLLKRYKKKVLINISIDSVNPSLHDSFRGLEGAFEKTCKNTKKMTEEGLTVRIASSIFEDNMWEIDKLAELALNLGAKVFTYNFVENFGRGVEFSKNKSIDKNKLSDYYKYIQATIEKYKDIIPIIESENFIKGSSNCGAGVTSIVIGADGNIRPCALTPRFIKLGNILDNKYKDIFKNNIFKEISEIQPPNENNGCPKDCKHYYHCRGCYLKALEINMKEQQSCEWIRANQLYKMLEYYKGSANSENNSIRIGV